MKSSYLVSLTSCLFLLCACGEGQSARDILGLGRNAPDEFKVVSRPPLVVPKDFGLRAPSDGADYANLPAADSAARAALTGEDEADILGSKRMMGDADTAVGIVRSYDLESDADGTFLGNIGASDADADIRQKLDAEQLIKKEAMKEKEEDFFGFLTPAETDDEEIVDAKAEKERLLENKAAGKKITAGKTPVIEKKQGGTLLENLF
jgi:hypothetical protein